MASKLCLCFAILLAYLEGSYGKVVNFKNCGPANVLQTVDVNPCTQEPCPVKKGENASVTLTFTTSGASPTAITSKAYGIVFGAQVPYPLPKPDGCKGCNLTCPLQPGPHVYLNDILIPTDVPSMHHKVYLGKKVFTLSVQNIPPYCIPAMCKKSIFQ